MTIPTIAIRLVSAVALVAGLAACTQREDAPLSGSSPAMAIRTPQEKSYLDPGPAAPRSGGPNYIHDNLTSTPRQTDSFGNDILRQSR